MVFGAVLQRMLNFALRVKLYLINKIFNGINLIIEKMKKLCYVMALHDMLI